MKTYLKRYLPEILVVVVFALISFVYFMPADMDGRILYREDSQAGRGAGMEINHYRDRTGKTTRWTNSIFGGMPTYQMAPSYKSDGLRISVTHQSRNLLRSRNFFNTSFDGYENNIIL